MLFHHHLAERQAVLGHHTGSAAVDVDADVAGENWRPARELQVGATNRCLGGRDGRSAGCVPSPVRFEARPDGGPCKVAGCSGEAICWCFKIELTRQIDRMMGRKSSFRFRDLPIGSSIDKMVFLN